jgi:L-lactate dehydrogenase complex protein LldF
MADHPGTTSPNESRRHFRKRVRKALNDPSLQRALRQALIGLRERRNRGFQSYDFATGRADLKQRRLANLERLPELLEEFKQRLEEVEGQFHYARDAEEARRIIGEICTQAGAGIVTKSKSMATEEILLNPYLESLGMEVVETDLGERMVQLKHSHPSHLIAPAIHLTKEDAAEVFGVEPTVEAIQAEARRSLREKFINASVGISGANAAIAETGSVMIVTNEGNADLTVTLPQVHIAVFGIDKLVATLDDATSMLRMLPRSGTGQRMSAYVNFITGPSRSADIEQSLTIGVHGPREMHCVVLDNGRMAMREDPIMRDALTCVRCGACSNACPPFMAVSGHQFGHIYNGPIGLVLTPFHHGHKVDDFPNSLCVQCNACQEICPVDIPLPRQILEHRRSARKPVWKTAMLDLWASTLVDPALRLAAPFSRLVPGAPAALATKPYRDRVKPTPAADSLGPTATIFASCLVDRILPGEGDALERILKAAGYRVEFPRDQWCCGLICANAGKFELGAKLSRQLHSALEGSRGPIITPSASCFGAFTMDAGEWGVDTTGREAVAGRMRDSTRFVLELLESRPELVDRDLPRTRVAYHDSCQSLRQLGLRAEPRRVLELAGYEVVDLPDIANCCGFGGTFSIEWPEVASRILDWKLEAVEKTGSAILASDNPGCLMHIGGGAHNRGQQLRVAHVLELIAERLAI